MIKTSETLDRMPKSPRKGGEGQRNYLWTSRAYCKALQHSLNKSYKKYKFIYVTFHNYDGSRPEIYFENSLNQILELNLSVQFVMIFIDAIILYEVETW